ncbi:MAG: hypothetical protein WKF34_03020 [Pyrinomonadaceae bacterium]
MKRVSQKVKDIVEVRPFSHLSDFAADPAATLSAYHFTDITADLMAQWLDKASGMNGAGQALALAGSRGVGKSHYLAVMASLLELPNLRSKVQESHVFASAGRLTETPPKVARVWRGSGPSLDGELKRGIAQALGVNPASLSESLPELLLDAKQRAGASPLAILIDTALGREARVTRDDGAALSELAKVARSLGIFVGLALDDDISGADGANASISASFAIDHLDEEHLYKVVDTFVFTKHSHMLPVLREIYHDYREALPGFRWSEPRFTSLYPLHPACVEIAPLIRFYIHDFALLGFAADSGIRIMGRPANSLIGLDEVYDNVEPRLRMIPALADVFNAFDRLDTEHISKSPVQLRLPAKLLLKGLFLLSLTGKGASVAELAASMMIYDGTASLDVAGILESLARAVPGSIEKTFQIDGAALYAFEQVPRALISSADTAAINVDADDFLGTEQVADLTVNFFGGADVSNAETQRLAKLFALPAGLAELSADGCRPSSPEALLSLDVVQAVLAHEIADDSHSMGEISSRLSVDPFNLSTESQHLLLTALVGQRLLDFITTQGNRITHRSLDLQIIWEDVVGVAEPLGEHYSGKRLLEWARLLTGNSDLKSLDTAAEERFVADELVGWLAGWREERALNRFNELPDESLNATIWQSAASLQKSLGAMADLVQLLANDEATLKQTLQNIGELFSDAESEFEKGSIVLRTLQAYLAEAVVRQDAVRWATLAEITEDPAVEAIRGRLIESLQSHSESLADVLTEFRAAYARIYITSHDEITGSQDAQARLAAIIRSAPFALLDQAGATGGLGEVRKLMRELTYLRCNAPVREILTASPHCTCSFRLTDSGRLRRLPVELETAITAALEAISRGDQLIGAQSPSGAGNAKDVQSAGLGEIFAGNDDEWEGEIDTLDVFARSKA